MIVVVVVFFFFLRCATLEKERGRDLVVFAFFLFFFPHQKCTCEECCRCVPESYEFFEALEHSRQRAMRCFENEPPVGLLNHFPERNDEARIKEHGSSRGKETLPNRLL